MEQIKPGYDRITTVLSPFSGMDKIPLDILNAAAERGSAVHALAQGLIEGIEVEVPDAYKGYIDSFTQWYEGKKFLPNPGRMYCDKQAITGECDGMYKIHNEIRIFDLKTSQKEGSTWNLQGAAYGHMIDNLDSTFVILNKHGGAPKEFHYSFKRDIQTFWKCLDLYRLFFKTKKQQDGYEFL